MGFDAGGSQATDYNPKQIKNWSRMFNLVWADVKAARTKKNDVAFSSLADPVNYFGNRASTAPTFPYGAVKSFQNWSVEGKFSQLVSPAHSTAWIPLKEYIDTIRSRIITLYDEWKAGRGVSQHVDQLVRRHAEIIEEQYFENIAPQVKQGFRDVNAIQSSAFVIALAKVWAKMQREVADYDGKVRLEAFLKMKDHEVDLIKVVFAQEGTFSQVSVALENLKFTAALERTKLAFNKRHLVANMLTVLANAAWTSRAQADKYKADALVASYKWKPEMDKTLIAAQSSLSGGTAGFSNPGVSPMQMIGAGLSAAGMALALI